MWMLCGNNLWLWLALEAFPTNSLRAEPTASHSLAKLTNCLPLECVAAPCLHLGPGLVLPLHPGSEGPLPQHSPSAAIAEQHNTAMLLSDENRRTGTIMRESCGFSLPLAFQSAFLPVLSKFTLIMLKHGDASRKSFSVKLKSKVGFSANCRAGAVRHGELCSCVVHITSRSESTVPAARVRAPSIPI